MFNQDIHAREIYWNIDIPEPWRTVVIVLLGLVPIVMIARGLRARWMEWKSVGGLDELPPRAEYRDRALRVLRHTLGQARVRRRRLGGHSHVLFFYSFIALFIGTLIVAFQHDIARPLFDWYFFKGWFYAIYSATLEVAGVLGIIAVSLALYRRLALKPTHLGGSINWTPSLWWFNVVLVTGFLVEAARIAGTGFPASERIYSFVGYALAGILPEGEPSARIHMALWWGHFFISLYFLGTFGTAAMSHVFTGAANIFLARDIPSGATPRPIENIENAEKFGVLTISDVRGVHLRDADVCVQCGRCTEVCPANLTGKPLSPKKLVNNIRDAWREREAHAADPGFHVSDLVGKEGNLIHPDEIWSCTTCGACEQECPVMIEVVEKVVELRRGQVLMKSDFPPEVQLAFTNLEQQGNPWGRPADERGNWALELEPDIKVPIVGEPEAEGAEILFWVGCAGSYDARAQKVSKSVARLLTRAGIKFAILGMRETCTGDSALRIGNEYLYQLMARQNIETLRESGIPKIVTACPHCFQTIAKDYRALGANFDVVHHSELLARLVAEGRLKPGQVRANAVLHDSCYLARHNGIIDQPRAVANAALGTTAVADPPRCREKGLCCGAGGGRMWMEEHLGHKTVNTERTEELLQAGGDTIVTSCPFCKTMMVDGAKRVAPNGNVEVKDIAELLDESTTPASS